MIRLVRRHFVDEKGEQRNELQMTLNPAELDSSLDSINSESDIPNVLWFNSVPTYGEFLDRCLLPNRPCILPPTLVQDWDVVKHKRWQKGDSDGVDWDYLDRTYGSQVSPVVICKTNRDEDRQEKTVAEAVKLVRDFQTGDRKDTHSIYIKDWHLIRQLCTKANEKEEAEPYTVPHIFADDWMNNCVPGEATASSVSDDDFRFVYAGTKGSRTALHRDVYTSYSWSTNVVGRKVWHLFPPSVIPYLRRFPAVETSQLVPDLETLHQITSGQDSNREYPHLQLAWDQVKVVVQEQGQTIFVPSNWYHQVENLDECISINRNWCNSVNIPSLYNSIKEELAHVEESLSDVQDMLRNNQRDGSDANGSWRFEFHALIQDVAIKDAGWAWLGFWNMVQHNLRTPAAQTSVRPNDEWTKNRLLPLIDDFETNPNTQYLTCDIVKSAQQCRHLLDSM